MGIVRMDGREEDGFRRVVEEDMGFWRGAEGIWDETEEVEEMEAIEASGVVLRANKE